MEAPPVQYVQTSDGFNIAYSVSGQGELLVSMPFPINDLDAFWSADHVRALTTRCRLVRYDSRGQGLSTRGLPESLSLEDYERDLEAVLDRLQLERTVLLAHAQFGHVAVRYAARRPERVKALILSSCRIDRTVGYRGITAARDLAEQNWELFLTTFRAGVLTFMPEMAGAFLGIAEMTTQPDWLRSIGVFDSSNIESVCRKLEVPTLVISMDIAGSPMNQVEDAKAMAAMIPNANLNIIRGNYASSLASALEDFLGRLPGDPDGGRSSAGTPDSLSPREVEVIRLIAAGKSNRQIANELVISLNTAQNHVSNILSKTGLTNRTEAASYARDHGYVVVPGRSD